MEKKAFLIEYEPRYLQRLSSVLQSKGWEVQIAKDGEEALKKLENYFPELIFLSAVLPKVRTAEVIKFIKSKPELKNAKVVLLATGIKDDAIETEKKKKAVDDILCKPFSETKIIECMEQLAPPPTPPPPKEEKKEGILDPLQKKKKKLTSEDLFGDFIGEKKSEPKIEKVEKKESVDNLLHKTLSEVGAPKPKKTEVFPKVETDIDKKLSETLSGIQIPTKTKKVPPPPKVEEKLEEKLKEEKIVEFPTEKLPLVEEVKVEEKKKEEELPPEEKGERFGNYILIEKLGTGGMAEIYKAKMEGVEGFQKLVAIKKILPQFTHNKDFTTMFIDEAKVAAQLSHRNIVHIYDLGKIENSYFIAMEYVEGTDLRKILHEEREKGRILPIPICLFIAIQVASALDYAHHKKGADGSDLNIVHRDVSPQNILISKDGEIKICDFGIAKAASKASHTRAGSLKGKLQYMSPEQAWGKPVDYRSDIFSLGVVLYEMLTGKHLFEGDSEISILEKVRNPKVEPISKYLKEYPKELEDIVTRALKEDPQERFQDANSFKKEMEEILLRYEPRVTEKTISEYLEFLEGTKEKFLEFKCKPPKKEEKVEEKPKEKVEEAKPIEIPKEEKIPEKEITPLKPPEIKMPKKKVPVLLEETTKEKKFPLWTIGAALAVVLIIVGIFIFSGGKKGPAKKISEPIKVEEQVPETPSPPEEIPKEEEKALEEPKKVETKPTIEPVKEEKKVEAPKKVEEPKKIEEEQEKTKKLVEETIPEKKETIEEIKKEEPSIEAPPPPPPPPPMVEEKKEPEKKETPEEPQKPKYKTGDFVDPGTPGLVAPKTISKATPAYPPIAKIQRIEGKVDVRVLVDENGNVIETKAISGHTTLRIESEKAAKKSKFIPAEIDGVKVKTYFTLSFEFKL